MRTMKLFLAMAFLMIGGNAFAQQQEFGPEWGENATQEERRQNVLVWNFFKDAYDAKDYDKALEYLPTLLKNSPKALQNIYVYGVNIYKNKAVRSRNLADKNKYIDSVVMIYDLRIEQFGDNAKTGRPYILRYKANDYRALRPADREGVRRYFTEAIDANVNNVDINFINVYFSELTNDYKDELIETDDYMAEYEKLAALLDKVTDPSFDEAKATFDTIFISSGAASCEGIEKIFKGRLESDPNNLEILNKAFNQLNSIKCYSQFYFQVGEKLFSLEQTSRVALLLAQNYQNAGNSKKYLEYLRAAVGAETDLEAKSDLCVRISATELQAKNYQVAADYANQAIKINSNNGLAYIVLAQVYAGAAVCDGFDRQTVFWLGYDLLMTARKIYAGDADQLKTIDQTAATFRANFPAEDELFFRGLSKGAAYDVKCGWIVGKTTVKEGAN